MSEEQGQSSEPKARGGSIPMSEVDRLADGIEVHTRTSWRVFGDEKGVRVALPRTNGVKRAYFYANGVYDLIPDDEAIKVLSPEERKERRMGGIQAEVDFGLGLEAARRALGKLFDVVREAKTAESIVEK